MSKVTLVPLDSFRHSVAYRTSVWVLQPQLDHLGVHLGLHPCDLSITRNSTSLPLFPDLRNGGSVSLHCQDDSVG